MATAIGMPSCALAALCMGVIHTFSTLGISIPISSPQKAPSWICSVSGCTSTRREGQSWGLGRGQRPLGVWFILHLLLCSNLCFFYSEFSSMREGWAAAIATTSREEFFQTAKEADPHSYVVMFDKLEYYADKHFTPPVPPFTPDFTKFMSVPAEMRNWVEDKLPKVCEFTLH